MNNKKGFTLIEFIIVSAIASFLGLGVVFAVVNSNKILNNSVKQSLFNGNVDLIMRDLSRDIKGGQILTTSEPVTVTENSVTVTYNTKLVIQYANATTVEWYSYNDKLMRKGADGSVKEYHVSATDDEYSLIEPHFSEAKQDGIYWGVEIKLLMYSKADGKYFVNNSAKNTFFTRINIVS